MEKQNDPELLREHLANERTFLAWLRTSIGIMAFGFVVVKFSLFVKQIAFSLGTDAVVPNRGYSAAIGILLVSVGALMCLFSFIRYKRTEKLIRNRAYRHNSALLIVITAAVLLMSVALILYLIETT
ncbi:YidH family protein [Flavobacterium rhizosphaerae]|uniref:DUF202 domain-containing protein n=1 Tax=Flavobacterium rhizosphaerae TaxID=3163298 RepID=A0ABW8YTK9_9FLAO